MILTEEEMLKIAKKYIKRSGQKSGIELAILEDASIKKEYGTIFHYNTKKYNETRNDDDNTLLGNAPFLVEKETGKVVIFGTSRSEEYYIDEYEQGTAMLCLHRYWYHEEDRYDYK